MIELNLSNSPAAYLDDLGKFSKMVLIEQSSKGGNKAKNAIRAEFRKQTTEWSKTYIDGKFVASRKTSKLGIRMKHQSGAGSIDNPSSMESMIQYFTNTTTGTTVIMGSHKSFKPILINNGVVGGYGSRVGAITRRTVSILEKLNSGKKSATYMKHFSKKGSVPGRFQGNQPYVQRNWAETGWSKVYPEIKEAMTTKLGKLIANYNGQKVKTA